MRKLVVGIAIGASAFLATIGLAWLGVFDDVELTAFDRRLIATHTPADASKDIVIIEINESCPNVHHGGGTSSAITTKSRTVTRRGHAPSRS